MTCPKCGMDKADWPNKNGVEKAGKTYCCQGCANGTGCTCPQPSSTGQSSSPAQRTPTKL